MRKLLKFAQNAKGELQQHLLAAWIIVFLETLLIFYWLGCLVAVSVQDHVFLVATLLFAAHFLPTIGLLTLLEGTERYGNMDFDAIIYRGTYPLTWGMTLIIAFVADLFGLVDLNLHRWHTVLGDPPTTATYVTLSVLYGIGFAFTTLETLLLFWFYATSKARKQKPAESRGLPQIATGGIFKAF